MTAPLRALGGAVGAVLLLWSWAAEAATLTVDAPEGCVDPSTLEQEVAALIGHSLAEVPEVDFRLAIARATSGKEHWHSRLEAKERDARGRETPAVYVRELDAGSCDELAEAAAVAIAVSVRALAREGAPPPSRSSVAVTAKAGAAPLATVAPAPAPWRSLATFAVVGDAGELPGAGLGLRVGASLTRAALRGAFTLGWIPPRDSLTAAGSGGQFQLAFAALDGCFAAERLPGTFLVCAGAELGAYQAEGIGVTSSFSRTTLWRAARTALGATFHLGGPLVLALDAGAIVPFSRPAFVVDEARPVYRAAAVAIRVGAGLEYWF